LTRTRTFVAVAVTLAALGLAASELEAEPPTDAGKAFLAETAKKPGVQKTASGLLYEIVKAGDGPKPKATDMVKVHYKGTLIDGKEFDSSYKRNQPAVFPVNRVITGWHEALQLMPVGSTWKLYIPSELAYGATPPPGAQIPPNAVLLFDVELLSIEKP
jgi:FKBP-type peptidyl-prolyl cis-trans isomerase